MRKKRYAVKIKSMNISYMKKSYAKISRSTVLPFPVLHQITIQIYYLHYMQAQQITLLPKVSY